MTWWGALGLALSLYGVIILLEWIYGRIMELPRVRVPHVSLVLRVLNQENRIEHAVHELTSLWDEPDWERSRVEVLISDSGSSDQTVAIVERLSRRYAFLNVVPSGLDVESVLARCRYPVVIWVELSRSQPPYDDVVQTVHRLLAQHTHPVNTPVA